MTTDKEEETYKETERPQKQGVEEEVAVEESEEGENVSLDPGESCADKRLEEVENILESR